MRNYLLSFWNIHDPVRLTKYKGKDVLLSDGTLIKKNDKLVKIHLHNVRLLSELKSVPCSVKKGRVIFRKIHMSMPLLSEYIHNHKQRNEIKGAIGITMLYKGA
jgi:hypothetical protein